MSEEFDPYQQWLGISPRERPADHYRLLGLAHFEANPAVIAQAADERMTTVRNYQTGPRGAYTQRLLNEISTARLCLLNADTKLMYDAVLQGSFAAAACPQLPPTAAPGRFAPTFPQPGVPFAPSGAPMALQMPASAYQGAVAVPVAVAVRPMTNPPLAMPVTAAPVATYSAPPAVLPPPLAPPRVAVATPTMSTANSAAGLQDEQETGSGITRGRVLGAAVLLAAIVAVWIFVAKPFGKTSHEGSTVTTDDTADTATDADSSANAEPPPPKPKDEPVLIEQEGSGQINFPASLAQIHGDSPQVEVLGDDILITNWTSADDWLSWRFHLARPGIFRVYIQYRAAPDADGGHFELHLDDETKTGDVRASEGDKFNTENLFLAVKRSGAHTVMLKPTAKPGAEFMILKSIRFEPQ